MEGESKDVFISYASEDKPYVVDGLVPELNKARINFFLDKNKILWGDSIISKINNGLESSKFLIVVLSKKSFKKKWVVAEIEAFMSMEFSGEDKVFLPLLAGSEEEIREILSYHSILKRVNYFKWEGNSKDVVKALNKKINPENPPNKNINFIDYIGALMIGFFSSMLLIKVSFFNIDSRFNESDVFFVIFLIFFSGAILYFLKEKLH